MIWALIEFFDSGALQVERSYSSTRLSHTPVACLSYQRVRNGHLTLGEQLGLHGLQLVRRVISILHPASCILNPASCTSMTDLAVFIKTV